ncbi:MAG: ion transporter [Thermoplasmatota archaeon]
MARRATVSVIDWILLALAIVSIGMLAYETWGNPTPEQTQAILQADLIIIGIFAIEFAMRWAKDDRPKTFLWRNWYDLLGMIPVAHPAIRGFRLFRIIRIVVLLSRFARATDRALGQEFVFRLVGRFKSTLADALAGAVTLRILEETEDVILKGRYTQNLANAIEARGEEMLSIAVEKVKDDPEVGAVRHIPYFEQIVATTSRVSQRIMIDLLRDPRMDDIVKGIIKQNTEQIKAEIRAREATET